MLDSVLANIAGYGRSYRGFVTSEIVSRIGQMFLIYGTYAV